MPPGIRQAFKWTVSCKTIGNGRHLQTKEWEKMLTAKSREMGSSEKHFRPNTNI